MSYDLTMIVYMSYKILYKKFLKYVVKDIKKSYTNRKWLELVHRNLGNSIYQLLVFDVIIYRLTGSPQHDGG